MTDKSAVPPPLRLSGLEPIAIGAGSLFVNIGERTNVTGSGSGVSEPITVIAITVTPSHEHERLPDSASLPCDDTVCF